jgi:hypothetical protein
VLTVACRMRRVFSISESETARTDVFDYQESIDGFVVTCLGATTSVVFNADSIGHIPAQGET